MSEIATLGLKFNMEFEWIMFYLGVKFLLPHLSQVMFFSLSKYD